MVVPPSNPFTPGQSPRFLAGRTAERRRIQDRLARVATYGELGGPLLVFHAPRGLGKTSLLRAAEAEAATLGFVSVWVACARDQQLLPELAQRVRGSLARHDALGDSGRTTRLEGLTVELGVPGARVQAALGRRDQPPATAPILAVEELLSEAAGLVRAHSGAGLVVFLDELHAADAGELAVLLNAWQNLDGAGRPTPLSIVTAGLPVTPEAITRAATFGERSTFVPLDLLADTDARTALVRTAEVEGVAWTDEALDLVTAEAHGHPYLLQLLGNTTWDAAAPSRGATLTSDDVRRGVPHAQTQLAAMHRARWGAATPTERAFLAAMAAVGDGNVTRAEIAAGMGRDSRGISDPRERLIEKGVIEPVGHGLVRFTLPGFGAYVRGLDEA
ncbi:ATP-binding protein [Nocardioides caeni]|uniref:ATP-binding protein n=1 Tax=Nocardioides caeni TaxID=574700 RepID=UPI00130520A9|nr:ATP-binding protein [Nocardioides caeni]